MCGEGVGVGRVSGAISWSNVVTPRRRSKSVAKSMPLPPPLLRQRIPPPPRPDTPHTHTQHPFLPGGLVVVWGAQVACPQTHILCVGSGGLPSDTHSVWAQVACPQTHILCMSSGGLPSDTQSRGAP
eukprot:303858-Chlamydomonas_euryale.AAC.1